jgi:hypothetical protein
MAHVTIACQRALIAARNTRNNTASAASPVVLIINLFIIADEKTINNPISLEDLNRRRL